MLHYATQPRPQDAFNASMSWNSYADAAIWSCQGYTPIKVEGRWILYAEESDAYVVSISNGKSSI